MNLELSDEQQMLQEAAAGTLARVDTVSSAREARDGARFVDLWPVAREAGWTGLLVSGERGGAGLGGFEAMLVLEQCGRRLAGAGLIGHLAATLVLERAAEAGDEKVAELLPELAAGERRAAMVFASPPEVDSGWQLAGAGASGELPAAEGEGDALRVSGAARHQLDLPGAALVVVPVQGVGEQPRAALIEASADGVEIEAMSRGDASRPLGGIILGDVPATPIEAGGEALAEAWHLAQSLLAADAIGVGEAMLEMGVAYAKERQAFGRAIGSYQAVKHQLVEILRLVDRARSLLIYAGFAGESLPEEVPLASAAARLAAEQASDYATRTCIAVHGGIGATWEHDAPYFWRRAQLSRLLLGGEAGAAERIAAQVIASARARTAAGEQPALQIL